MALTYKLKKNIANTLIAWGIIWQDILNIPKVPDARYDLIRYQRSCLIKYLVLNHKMTYIQITEQLGIPFGTVCKIMSERKQKTKLQLEVNGEKKSITEWAKITGISYGVIYYRSNIGYSDEKILKPILKSNT